MTYKENSQAEKRSTCCERRERLLWSSRRRRGVSRCNNGPQPRTSGCSGLDSAPAAASQPHNQADGPERITKKDIKCCQIHRFPGFCKRGESHIKKNTSLLVLWIQNVIQPLVEVAIRGEANIVSYRPTTQHSRHGLENQQHFVRMTGFTLKKAAGSVFTFSAQYWWRFICIFLSL